MSRDFLSQQQGDRASTTTPLAGRSGQRPRRAVSWALGLALAFPVMGGSPAQAAPDNRNKEAKALFQAGKYIEAAEIYAKLRDERQSPNYTCNLGLCYARLNALEPAIETVKQCLETAKLAPEVRADYEGLLAQLEAQRPQSTGAAPAAAAAVVPPAAADVGLVAVPDPAGAAGAAATQVSGQYPPGDPAWQTAPGAPTAPPAEGYGYADPNNPYGYGYQQGYPPPGPGGWGTQGQAAPEAEQAKPDGKRRIPFGSYVTGLVGAVSTAMGVALVLHSQAIQQEIEGASNQSTDRALLQNDLSRAKSGTVAAFVIGGVGLSAAVIWAIVAPSYVKPELASGSGNGRGKTRGVGLAVGPQSIALSGRF